MDMLEHGFYEPAYRDEEIDNLDTHLAIGIQNEIDLMRIYIRRMAMLAKGIDKLDEAIFALGALGNASTQLARMLRSQKALREDSNRTAETISTALTEVMKEFNLR